MTICCNVPDPADPATGAPVLGEGVEDLLEAVRGARQHDGPGGAGCAELLLRHVEQLAEGVAAEVVDGDEEPPPVPGVRGKVTPRACRRSRGGDLAAAAVPLPGDLRRRQLQWAHHDPNAFCSGVVVCFSWFACALLLHVLVDPSSLCRWLV
jgi:hypothetical protein